MTDYFEKERQEEWRRNREEFGDKLQNLEGEELHRYLQSIFPPNLVLAMLRLKDSAEKSSIESNFQATVLASLAGTEEGVLATIDAMIKQAQRCDDLASSYRQVAVAMQEHIKRKMGLTD